MLAAIVSMTTVKTKAEIWSECLMPLVWPSSGSHTSLWFSHRLCPLNHSNVVDTSGHGWTDGCSTLFSNSHTYSQASITHFILRPTLKQATLMNAGWWNKHTCRIQQPNLLFWGAHLFPVGHGFLCFHSAKWAENEETFVYTEKQLCKWSKWEKEEKEDDIFGLQQPNNKPLPHMHTESCDERVRMMKYSKLMMHNASKPCLTGQLSCM